MDEAPLPLTDSARVVLLLAFGAISVAVIVAAGELPMPRLDLLILATSSGALVTAMLWVVLLAMRRSGFWGWAMLVGVWIPYINLVLASIFVRRHWKQGGRAPALLGLLGIVGQTVASLRLMVPSLPPLV